MTVFISVTTLGTPWYLFLPLGSPLVPLGTPLVALDTILVPLGTPSVPPTYPQSQFHIKNCLVTLHTQ